MIYIGKLAKGLHCNLSYRCKCRHLYYIVSTKWKILPNVQYFRLVLQHKSYFEGETIVSNQSNIIMLGKTVVDVVMSAIAHC